MTSSAWDWGDMFQKKETPLPTKIRVDVIIDDRLPGDEWVVQPDGLHIGKEIFGYVMRNVRGVHLKGNNHEQEYEKLA